MAGLEGLRRLRVDEEEEVLHPLDRLRVVGAKQVVKHSLRLQVEVDSLCRGALFEEEGSDLAQVASGGDDALRDSDSGVERGG